MQFNVIPLRPLSFKAEVFNFIKAQTHLIITEKKRTNRNTDSPTVLQSTIKSDGTSGNTGK